MQYDPSRGHKGQNLVISNLLYLRYEKFVFCSYVFASFKFKSNDGDREAVGINTRRKEMTSKSKEKIEELIAKIEIIEDDLDTIEDAEDTEYMALSDSQRYSERGNRLSEQLDELSTARGCLLDSIKYLKDAIA